MIQCERCGQQNKDSEFACVRCGMVLQRNNDNNYNTGSNLTQNYQNQVFKQISPEEQLNRQMKMNNIQNSNFNTQQDFGSNMNQNTFNQGYQPNFSPNSNNVQSQQQYNQQMQQYNPQYNQPPYQQPPMYQNFQPNVQPVAQNNGMATASLILGIIANVCCGFPVGIVALILGIIGLSKSKTMCGNGKGMAIAGIILGAVSIVWGIAAMVIYSVYGYAIFQTIQNDYDYSTDFYSMIRMYLPL